MAYRKDAQEMLEEVIRGYFDLDELAEKVTKETAEDYVMCHEARIQADIEEKLEEGMENLFDAILDETIEKVVWG